MWTTEPRHQEFLACLPDPVGSLDSDNTPFPTKREFLGSKYATSGDDKLLRVREKNNRAQKRFRQRKKERVAELEANLAILRRQLQSAEASKTCLEQEVRQLQRRADARARVASNGSRADSPLDPELGFSGVSFTAKGGINFRHMRQQTMSHEELMNMTIQDLFDMNKECLFRVGEILLRQPEENADSADTKTLQTIFNEQNILLAWTAAWRPQLYLTFAMNPMELSASEPPLPLSFFREEVKRLKLTKEQKEHLAVSYREFVEDIQKNLAERKRLVALLPAAASSCPSDEEWETQMKKFCLLNHLSWNQMARALKHNLDMCFARECVLYGTAQSEFFVHGLSIYNSARFLLDCYPHVDDIYQLLQCIAEDYYAALGEDDSIHDAKECQAVLEMVNAGVLPDPLTEDPAKALMTVQDHLQRFVLTLKLPLDSSLSIPESTPAGKGAQFCQQ